MAGPGGAKPKQGLLPKNGCLRLVIFYIGSVAVVALGIIILGSGVLANLPVIGPTLGGIGSQVSSGSSVNSNGIVPVSIQPLSSGGGGPGTTGSGNSTQIDSRQVASPQGGVLPPGSARPSTLPNTATRWTASPRISAPLPRSYGPIIQP